MTPLSDKAPIVDQSGRPARHFLAAWQALFRGVIKRQVYTFAELDAMSPDPGSTAFCSDSSVTTFGSALAGTGSTTVPVYADGSGAWRVG